MRERTPDSFYTLKARAQRTLIEFLNVDLDLAFTFLETAKNELGRDDEHCRAALDKARAALVSVRNFQGRIEDLGEWEKIQDRSNGLDAKLNAFTARLPGDGYPKRPG